ncbi:hypothetical protein SCUP234_12419 [Seiridium cupressi]
MARQGRDTPASFATGGLNSWWMPAIEPMNGTGGEQWEFDGVSLDGGEAFIFGFYRDPNYSILGSGNLRAYAEFALKNGSRYAVVDYAEEATLEECQGLGSRGVWKGKNHLYEFVVSEDMSRTSIIMNTPEAKVRVDLVSVVRPRYADNSPWPMANASSLTVPHFYWVEPVPAAKLEINAIINGEEINYVGMGGSERLWGAFNWFTCLSHLVAVKFIAGPYALSFLDMGSALQRGNSVGSVILAKDGETIAATRRTERSDTEDYIEIRKIYGGPGATTPDLRDKVTGAEVVIHSPSQKKTWMFDVQHKKMLFEYNLGGGDGGTAYSGTAKGGLVDSKDDWSGPAFTEFMRMPRTSWLLQKNYPT